MSLFNMMLGGGSGGEIKSIEATPDDATQLSFRGITKEPSWWLLVAGETTGSTSYYWLILFGSEYADNASYINTMNGNIIKSTYEPRYQISNGSSFVFSFVSTPSGYEFDRTATYTLYYIE